MLPPKQELEDHAPFGECQDRYKSEINILMTYTFQLFKSINDACIYSSYSWGVYTLQCVCVFNLHDTIPIKYFHYYNKQVLFLHYIIILNDISLIIILAVVARGKLSLYNNSYMIL